METIIQWSPFSSEEDLLRQVNISLLFKAVAMKFFMGTFVTLGEAKRRVNYNDSFSKF